MILTGEDYRNNSVKEFVKKESWLLLIVVDRKRSYLSYLLNFFWLMFTKPVKTLQIFEQCDSSIDKMDACFLCFFQQTLRQNESFCLNIKKCLFLVVHFKVARELKFKLVFKDYFLYNLVILIKLCKIRYLN